VKKIRGQLASSPKQAGIKPPKGQNYRKIIGM